MANEFGKLLYLLLLAGVSSSGPKNAVLRNNVTSIRLSIIFVSCAQGRFLSVFLLLICVSFPHQLSFLRSFSHPRPLFLRCCRCCCCRRRWTSGSRRREATVQDRHLALLLEFLSTPPCVGPGGGAREAVRFDSMYCNIFIFARVRILYSRFVRRVSFLESIVFLSVH